MKVIAAHHGLPLGVCWRCAVGCDPPERAHMIDRVFGGLDGPQNLALLCSWCHRHQPAFRPGDEAQAVEYCIPDDPCEMRRVDRVLVIMEKHGVVLTEGT